ncbi:MAG: biopolymer transporter ExbD [Akkermansia sp.]|nr:biopolymer transporter ExbD [Akkermansia sp.]
MKLNSKIPEPVGFQLAPLLDVVFLLLIFFVVTQKIILNEQDLKVKVPTAPKTSEETSRAIDEIIINAREENGELVITIDREIFTRDALLSMLQRMVKVNENVPVRIRGDAEMHWQKMADVISTCTQAGVWNVSFSKKMPEEQNAK